MINGYEKNYLNLIFKLKECDFKDASKRLGLKLLPDEVLSVDYLLRNYIITKDGVEASDGKPSRATDRSILLFYTISKGEGEPAFSYSLLHAFSNGLIPSTSNTKMVTPLTLSFGGQLRSFKTALAALGAKEAESGTSGEHCFTYTLLPKIPCLIKYVEEDEDFPSEVKVLLDNNAGRFLEFEQMAFLIGSISEALISIG